MCVQPLNCGIQRITRIKQDDDGSVKACKRFAINYGFGWDADHTVTLYRDQVVLLNKSADATEGHTHQVCCFGNGNPGCHGG